MKHVWTLVFAIVFLTANRLIAHPGHETNATPALTEVVALVFSDFHSAPCAEVNGLLDALAQSRHLSIQRIFKHAPSSTEAIAAHEAVLAAGAQGKFLEMHDLLFKQAKPAGSVLLRLAESLGLDRDRFETALDDRQFRNMVAKDIAEARGLGVKSTPTVFLNGARFDGLDGLKSLLRGSTRPAAPAWESLPAESLKLDLEGSPSFGSTDAPVTIIEFTDFRCGFCRIHSQVLSELVAAYPHQIRRVFKHYPLESQGPGLLPHLASMVASSQGRFWEMHQAIMNEALEQGQPDLRERAMAVGILSDVFQRGMVDPKFKAMVERDEAEGESLGIRATPTTFINGRRLVGRQSIETLKGYVSEILSSRKSDAGVPAVGASTKPVGNDAGPIGPPKHLGTFPLEEASCERGLGENRSATNVVRVMP
ncbi:MAG: thioredoxin domain-containing protein [Verrucomicrobiales bacterium]|nr:thioredoxin domain-containing protein [Verrucomicrobiales bacterium]